MPGHPSALLTAVLVQAALHSLGRSEDLIPRESGPGYVSPQWSQVLGPGGDVRNGFLSQGHVLQVHLTQTLL